MNARYDPHAQPPRWSEPVRYVLDVMVVRYRDGRPVGRRDVQLTATATNVNDALASLRPRRRSIKVFPIDCRPAWPVKQ